MTSIAPKGIATPVLSGGPHAQAAAPLLAALGFRAEVASEKLGVASAIKMCRSVIVKGMEAIVIESFVAARKYGVENEVLAWRSLPTSEVVTAGSVNFDTVRCGRSTQVSVLP